MDDFTKTIRCFHVIIPLWNRRGYMEVENIKYFVVLCEKKKFIDAAYECNLSQSSLSKKIKKLETELNTQLLNRSAHETTLTKEGQQFYKYAKQMLRIYEKALSEIHSNSIRLACMSVLSPYHIAKTLYEFSSLHENVDLYVKESNAKFVLDHVEEYDLVMIREYLLKDKNEYQIYPFVDDELCVVVSNSHPLSKKKRIWLKDIQNESLIFPEKGSGGYEIFVDSCIKSGFEPNIVYEMPHTSTMFSFVQENVGVALSFKKVYEEFSDNKIKMLPLKDDLHYPVVLAHKKEKKLTAIQKEFLEFCNCKNLHL